MDSGGSASAGEERGTGVLDESRPAAHRAERVHGAVVLGEVPGVGAVHGHAAHRVESARCRRRRARGSCAASRPATRRRAGRRDERRPAAAHLDQFGEDRDRDLLGRLGAQVDAGRCPQRSDPLLGDLGSSRSHARTAAARFGDATRPTYAPRASAPPDAPPRPRCPGSRRRRTAPRRCRAAQVGRARDPLGAGECVGIGDRVEHGHSPAGRAAEGRQGGRDRASRPRSTAAARADAVPRRSPASRRSGRSSPARRRRRRAAPRPGLLREPEQAGLTVGERAQRLADDDGLGAAAADPALDRAVRMDDAARARAERRSAAGPRRPSRARTAARPLDSSAARAKVANASRSSAAVSEALLVQDLPTPWAGVIGMSMLRTPRCHSASTTALAIAGGAPTVADSPTPLAPIG